MQTLILLNNLKKLVEILFSCLYLPLCLFKLVFPFWLLTVDNYLPLFVKLLMNLLRVARAYLFHLVLIPVILFPLSFIRMVLIIRIVKRSQENISLQRRHPVYIRYLIHVILLMISNDPFIDQDFHQNLFQQFSLYLFGIRTHLLTQLRFSFLFCTLNPHLVIFGLFSLDLYPIHCQLYLVLSDQWVDDIQVHFLHDWVTYLRCIFN